MGLFSFLFKKKALPPLPDIVGELESLGYFRYADDSCLDMLKNELKESFEKHRILDTELDNESLLYKDHRLYFCDGEDLFEEGGITSYLRLVQKGFEKRGLTLEWDNDVWEEDGNELTHTIRVNGKQYVLFEGIPKIDCWGIAQLNFYLLLNDQLELQHSDERVFPISGGENGQFVILSPAQVPLIMKWFYNGPGFNIHNRIYPLTEWARVHGLKQH